MTIQRDDEVSEDAEAGEKQTVKMKKRLAENLDADTKVAKEKRREKKLKAKKRLRAENGNEEEAVVTLGNPDDQGDSSEQGSEEGSEEGGSGENSSDEESIEYMPLKKRQKTSEKETGAKASSTEDRALALLSA